MTTIAAAAERHAAGWQGRLPLLPNGAFDARSIIAKLPALVAQAYPPIAAETLERVTVALCLFSDAVVLSDDVIDYAASIPATARRVPDIAVLYAQAYRTFAEVFGGAPGFWNRLERYFIDYVDAMNVEAALAAGERDWASCGEDDCLAVARGKNGLVRLVDAAVAALCQPDAHDRKTDDILLHYFVANQMIDDLRDWREDIRDGALSLVLRRASAERPRGELAREIGRRIYLDGHAAYVLGVARRELEAGLVAAQALHADGLIALHERRIDGISALRERVAAELESAR
jgi:squalene-hopene/tetraprenyl-beta-curcumene cyclase